MTAKLFCKTGELAGSEFLIQTEAVIGQNSSNQIVLSPSVISGNHARIFFDEDKNCYFLEDLKSRNGTKLDGMRIAGKEKLGLLHVITFSDAYDFIFQAVADRLSGEPGVPKPAPPAAVPGTMVDSDLPLVSPKFQPGGTSKTTFDAELPTVPKLGADRPNFDSPLEKTAPAPKTSMDSDLPLVPRMSPGESKPRTVLDQEMPSVPKFTPSVGQARVPETPSISPDAKKGCYLFIEDENRSIPIQEGENIIGRDRKSSIWIDHATVSRRHAVLRLKAGKVTVEDLGSANHTFVDGRQIQSEEEVGPDNRVRFGTVNVRFILQ